jgi:hypothetical protein
VSHLAQQGEDIPALCASILQESLALTGTLRTPSGRHFAAACIRPCRRANPMAEHQVQPAVVVEVAKRCARRIGLRRRHQACRLAESTLTVAQQDHDPFVIGIREYHFAMPALVDVARGRRLGPGGRVEHGRGERSIAVVDVDGGGRPQAGALRVFLSTQGRGDTVSVVSSFA